MRFHLTAALAFLAVLAAALWVFAASASSESTPEVGRAVQAVQQEVEFAQVGQQQHNHPFPAGYLASVAAFDYTVGHVLTPLYGYRAAHGIAQPDNNPEAVLEAQAGICGHAVTVFRTILGQLGYQTRSVGFAVPGNSHDSAEVLYEGAWHWFDPTFGVYYRQGQNVLPISAARQLKHPDLVAVTDRTLLWRQIMGATAQQAMGSGMAMPLNPDARVTYTPAA